MASQNEPITTTDVVDYAGELFFVGATFGKSPLLSYKGLTTGYKTATGNNFPMCNYIAGDAGAQDGQTEDASIAAMTNTSYTATQVTQYMQMFRKSYVESYASQALNGAISGAAVMGMGSADVSAIETQRMAHLKQFATDYEYSALRGSYAAWTNASTAGKMQGLVTAVEGGSETPASDAALSTTFVNAEIERMAAAGAEFGEMVIAANAHQINALNALYGNAIQSATVAGMNIATLTLPIAGACKIIYDPVLATDDLVFVDMNHFDPVFSIVPGKPAVFVETLAKLGAGEYEQMYSLASVDYGDIMFHGMVSGLATT